ncbi:MAG: aspartate aminotransferase family protein [Candidatus Eisenbacteria bacterium]
MTPSAQTTRSQELYERALRVLPGGVSRNTVLRRPHPFYAVRGEGCYVTDIEGVRRIDFANNMCSLIHGHAHPAIVAAVTEQMHCGTAFTFATEAEVLYAEHMCQRSPGLEKIRFVNSGTEAVMSCLKAARAFTGRAKIAKAEGAYHGLYDYAEVSQTSNPANWGDADHPRSNPVVHGTPQGVLDDVIVIPFNDPEAAVRILSEHAGELACVLIDPLPHRIGMMRATAPFIDALRRWTEEDGSLLVFDEVITFRSEFAGAQSWFSRPPDLTALGKMIGGGLPVGAIAGRADVMDVLNPLAEKVLFPHSGTFSANPLVMTAGLTAMRLFDRDAVARLNELGDRARRQIADAIQTAGFPACVTGAGSLFRIHMTPEPPATYRQAYVDPGRAQLTKALLDHTFENGVMLINTGSGALSTAMTGREIDVLSEVLLSGFRKLKEMQ